MIQHYKPADGEFSMGEAKPDDDFEIDEACK